MTNNNRKTTCWPGSSNSICLSDLYHTVQEGKWEIVEILLKQRVNHRYIIGSLQLLAALAYTKRLDLLLSILGHKPSGESAPLIFPQPRVSILALAVQLYAAQPDLLPLALSYRNPAQIRNEESGGALDLAASKYPSDTRALEILLDAGASECYNILKSTIRSHRKKLLRILLKHGANVYANYPYPCPICKHCLKAGRSIRWNPNALWMVIDQAFKGMLEVIMDEGVDITKIDESKSTILHYATGYDLASVIRRDIITLLLAKGVPINARNLAGKTALDYAIGKRSFQLVGFLKDRGAMTGTEVQEIEPRSDLSLSTQHLTEAQKVKLSMLELKDASKYVRYGKEECSHSASYT